RTHQGPQPALQVYSLPLKYPALQEQVNRARLAISRPGMVASPGSRGLFKTLFPAPAQKQLQQARRLLISPDGLLWEVPFAALGERGYFYREGAPPAPLPATRGEAIRIARFYGGPPLLGAQATEAAVRQRIGAADVIHLATHGYLHPMLAMSSGLLLTVPEQE